MKKTSSRTYKKLIDLCIFLLFLFTSSFQFNGYRGVWGIAMCYCLLLLLFLISDFSLSRGQLFFVLLLITFFLITGIITDEPSKQLLIYLNYILISLLFVGFVGFKSFKTSFFDCVVFLAICSLLLLFIKITIFPLYDSLPSIRNSGNIEAKTIFVATMKINSRLQSIFWEPGAFQFFLNMAILFYFFDAKIRANNSIYKSIILIITVILTFSTTGIFTTLLLIVVFFIQQSDRKMRKRVAILTIILLGAVIVAYRFFLSDYLRYVMWGKITAFLNSSDTDVRSVTARLDSLKAIYFIKTPLDLLFGIGRTTLSEQFKSTFHHSDSVFTFGNALIMQGIFWLGVFLIGIYKLFRLLGQSRFVSFCLLGIVIINTISEDFTYLPTFLVFVFYGFERIEVQFNM